MKDYQNTDRLSVFMIFLLQRKPTGPHKTLDWTACGPRAVDINYLNIIPSLDNAAGQKLTHTKTYENAKQS